MKLVVETDKSNFISATKPNLSTKRSQLPSQQ